ncbi:MAG: glycosyltransferase [Phycisphaerales bacterium]
MSHGVLGGARREANHDPLRAPSTATAPKSAPTIAFAGGGSGGHISPGLAIAERLRELAPHARLLFLCSTRAIDATMLAEADAPFYPLRAAPMSARPLAFVRFVAAFRRARAEAEEIIERERVTQLVALGGFVAAPAAAAAVRRHVPVTLVNLDAIPVAPSRWLARPQRPRALRRADRNGPEVHAAIEQTGGSVVGMPLRRAGRRGQ